MKALLSKYKNYFTFFILLILLISIKVSNPSFVKSISFISFDLYQKIFPLEKNETEVVIIDIDDNSLAQIGQWPWSRNTLAELTNQAYLAAALGFDVVFAEPDRSNPQNLISLYPENEILSKELNALPNNDQLFADAIANHGTVVLGQALSNQNQSLSISNKYGLVTQGDDPKQFLVKRKMLIEVVFTNISG